MQHQTFDIPQTGYVRQIQLVGDYRTGARGVLPFSATTLWRRVRAGTFPAPIKLSRRITCWRAEDVRAWIESAGEAAK
ncbi:AlpA family phage regulatory protein [Laribacter hongkongensis]|uniref:helix-turn-helix transcriptional regulator n=1 Tax=Laribacter hongkongensis TaxID=168471 RepID=UPI001B663898|nr:AlpA family phage regulatory protein [Laribacter hongkongensis]MBP9527142.1 AlpA family phage regulatory protein [Laribacter sp.]MCG8994138.1 AlpA family phage regulatory protein [Laribacter hongkongensis]MCG9011779.1 AlpA family phage regulatory protein [Laribacter hongkongensis]MCG9046730.1 AlpA family phage regulatory protein [Laribacter hongkongensis]MCG9065195.1 AlpA family phage regulatory protein [Laribacter hongkongensis]